MCGYRYICILLMRFFWGPLALHFRKSVASVSIAAAPLLQHRQMASTAQDVISEVHTYAESDFLLALASPLLLCNFLRPENHVGSHDLGPSDYHHHLELNIRYMIL